MADNAGSNAPATMPTTEIPVKGSTAPADGGKLLSGDSSIDRFLDLPDSEPGPSIHEEMKALQEPIEGGETDGEKLQEGQESEEVTDNDSAEVKDKVSTEEGAEQAPDNKQSDKPEPNSTSQANEAPSKVIIAKVGDKSIELEDSATFTFKVDGKEVTPQLSDLIQNYKGKIPWDRHYRQLKQDRAKFDADVKAIDGKIREIVELSKSDPYKALERTMIMAGKNPADFLSVYLQQAQKTAEDMEGKSEDEIKAWVSAKRSEYEQEQAKLERQRLDAEKAEMGVQKFITEKQTEHSITDEELESAWQFANLPENSQYLAGKTPQQIAETIINYITSVERPYTLIESTVGEVAPELRKNGAFVKELYEHFRNYPNLTRDDIKIVVEGYLGKNGSTKSHATPSKEAVEDRAEAPRANPPKTSPEKTAKRSTKLEEFDPLTGGDLDELTQLLAESK